MSALGTAIDERFLMHRLRATSIASIAGGSVAMGLFIYHNWVDHVWNWELFSIGLTMAVVKQGLMAWYRRTN
jgi:hypothetical protein